MDSASSTAAASAVADPRLTDTVRTLLARDVHEPVIGNGRRSGDGALTELRYPATGQRVAAVRSCTEADVEEAVRLARTAQVDWRRTPPATRSLLLLRLADLVERDAETLAQLEVLNTGKSVTEARGDVARATDGLRFYAGCARQVRGETIAIDERFRVSTIRRPVGVVAAIVPWNVPLVLTVCKSAPALAAGNAVIVKPAELTPLTALVLAELALEAGLAPGLLQTLPGRGSKLGPCLVDHPGIDKITFTGSTETGVAIARQAATTVKAVALELGGKSPHIVFEDADLEAAGRALARGIF